MKKSLQLVLFLVIAASSFANGLSLNSIGSKAFGMGGAFVGLANDPSAIHWNPAGMVGQKNNVMLFTTDVIPMAQYTSSMLGVETTDTKINNYISPNLMGVYNYKDFAFGFGAYVPAGLGAEWDGADLTSMNDSPALEFEWMSEIAVFNFSPAFAYKLTENIYLGAAANIYYSMMEMKRPTDLNGNGLFDTQTHADISGMGFGSVLSMKVRNDMFDFGLTYKTPVMVDYEGTMTIDNPMIGEKDMEFHIEWPTWIGAGLAVRPFEKFVMEFDVQYTNWNEITTLTADIDDLGADEMHLYWNDAVQYRLGAEYQINREYAVRAGWYLDPAPCGNSYLNILFPSSTNQVGTAGMSYFNKDINLNVDFGMEYVFGMTRDIQPAFNPFPHMTNMPGVHKMDIFAFSLGVGYSFK